MAAENEPDGEAGPSKQSPFLPRMFRRKAIYEQTALLLLVIVLEMVAWIGYEFYNENRFGNSPLLLPMLFLVPPTGVAAFYALMRSREIRPAVPFPGSAEDPYLSARLRELETRVANTGMNALREEFRGEIRELRNAVTHSKIARTEIAREANLFADEADRYQAASRWWLFLGGLTGAMLGVFVFLNYYRPHEIPGNGNALVTYVTGRVLLFSFLGTIFVWCISNQRSNYHNHVVNRHRAMSLNFYIQMQSGLHEASRNDLLTEVVRSIISPQASGYVGADAPNVPAVSVVNQARDLAQGRG